MGIDFPVVKLVDFADSIEALEANANPFALVTLAHLLARQTRGQAHRRRVAKWKLTRLLYERDWSRQRIIDLYRVIDWIMRLPSGLDKRLRQGILQLERRRTMTYLSSIERIGMEIGMKKGEEIGKEIGKEIGTRHGQAELLSAMITQRFGAMAPDTQLKLEAANPRQLIAWGRNFVDATTLDEVFRNK